MSKFGTAAEIAAKTAAQAGNINPRIAWKLAVAKVFRDSRSSQLKSCPRDAFLALCEFGAVENIMGGSYTRSVKNRNYAKRALEAIRQDSSLLGDEKRLWRIATNPEIKKHNQQMDVVVTLFNLGLVR
jgi:hypothetical protein